MKKIQHKIQKLQIENKQLKNRMADIKSNYISHYTDFENIKKLLNDLNNKTNTNLKKLEDNEKNLIYVVVQIDKINIK